jgi:hypothetical protein
MTAAVVSIFDARRPAHQPKFSVNFLTYFLRLGMPATVLTPAPAKRSLK